MKRVNYGNIWKLLSTNDFKKQIPKKFHCTLCNNVAIEPFIASCECRFCSRCIKDYLEKEIKKCPGRKSECMEECLEIGVNVLRDVISIRSITRLKVKCLNDLCDSLHSLDSMSDHLKMCRMSSGKCPYETIGCEEGQIYVDNIKTHYHDEWLLEEINNLKNDFTKLNKVLEIRDEKINELQNDSERKEMTIIELKQQIALLNDRDGTRDKELEEIREDLQMMKETQKNITMEEIEKKDDTKREIGSVIMKVRDLQSYNEREFIWKVDKFSKIKDNGGQRDMLLWKYSIKLYLTLWCQRGNLGYGCTILKGDFDEFLKWPMKYSIILSLINQDTMKVNTYRRYSYDTYRVKAAFKKPTDKISYFIGDNNFMSVKEIMNSPGLLLNDSLIVSFIIDY